MTRPDPEAILARLRQAEASARRGKLTVFFGAAPGVGKTYAMLEAARLEKEAGRDVVVGLVETHGRYDTAALLLGHELLPRCTFLHRGIELEELDLDAVLARAPSLLLVDELAHTNAPGSRHIKRWQDVEEILDAGIDVYTTLNVQHLESLNDVVAQITHVIVRETVPDKIFEAADDVRVLDLPIDELLQRLREGKIYRPEQAERAARNFFDAGNLIALRELALRTTAQRVDAEMREYRADHGIDRTWPVADRLLVSVSPSPASESLIRAARRVATATHADWIVAYVETPAALGLSAADHARVQKHLQLALSLGAETVTLAGERAPAEIVRFARSRNVTRILVGKPTHARWRDRFTAPFLDEVVRLSGDIDVHVLSSHERAPVRASASVGRSTWAGEWPGFAAAALGIAATTAIAVFTFGRQHIADAAMAYLLTIVLIALRWGLRPSLVAALTGVLAFDFFFIPPYHTFAVANLRHVVTFAVMFIVAAVISGLTARVRTQVSAARERELRTASLYALSRTLATAKTTVDVARAGSKHLHDVFGVDVAVFLPDARGELSLASDGDGTFRPDEKDSPVVAWVWQHGKPAGAGTDTLPSTQAHYIPLCASDVKLGVLGVVSRTADDLGGYDRGRHLDAFVGQIAGALDRTRLAAQAETARVRIEAEQLRNALLSSVSHDLRTPLAIITGTASTLLEPRIDEATRRELAEAIVSEAERLNRLVRNLLDMTRLESGVVTVNKEWQPIEEAVGPALERTSPVLGARPITAELSPALVPYDSLLLQQVLVNLLENAAKYTPPGSPLEIRADVDADEMVISVLDRGGGLPPGEEVRIFDKFYRVAKGGGGVGLGLSICKSIVVAHGGRIWAEPRAGGGTAFRFTLPIEGVPPALDPISEVQP